MHKSYLQLGNWSDTELIAAVASFDAAAYAELQERHAAAARTFAAQLSADPADVEPIVAGTFAQLHDVLREAAGPKVSLRPYLYTALRWAAHDHLGSRRAKTAGGAMGLPADTTLTVGPAAEPELAADKAESAAERPADAAERPAGTPDAPADTAEPSADTAEAATEQPAGAGGAAREQAPDLGEPLFTDPAIADLVRSPLYRAFRSLPERFRAVLWHTEIEQIHPALTAMILGLSLEGVEDLADEARDGLRQACLGQHMSDVVREDCTAALAALGNDADPVSGSGALMAQRHLAGCTYCRAAATEVADLRKSLRRVIAPVFLGAATAAYLSALSAAKANAADASLAEAGAGMAGPGVGGLRWTRQQPSRTRRRARPPGVLLAGGAVLCVLALTGFALAAVSTAARQSSPGAGAHAAAAAPTVPAGGPGSSSSVPSPTPGGQTLVSPDPQATTPAPATPAPTTSAPTTPVPTTSVPTTPAPTPTPCPTPKHCRLRPCRCPTPPPPP